MIRVIDADALMALISFAMAVDVVCTFFRCAVDIAIIEEIKKISRREKKEIDYD